MGTTSERLAEYAWMQKRNGMTKRLRVGEYGITKSGLIIARHDGAVWGGNNHYEAFPPIGYSWEFCNGGFGVHSWNEPTLSLAREYDPTEAISCSECSDRNDDEVCFWENWIHEPDKHHPIELMDSPYNTLGVFNPFFS